MPRGLDGLIPLVHLVWGPHFVGVICGIGVCVFAWIRRGVFVDWAAWDQDGFGHLVMFSETWGGMIVIVLLHGWIRRTRLCSCMMPLFQMDIEYEMN